MGRLKERRLVIPLVLLASWIFIACGCSGIQNNSISKQGKISPPQPSLTSSSKIAAPFKTIVHNLVTSCDFPVFLPTYLPSPYRGSKWSLNLEKNQPISNTGLPSIQAKKNNFSIAINQVPGPWCTGLLSGNVGYPPEPALEKQFQTQNIKIRSVNLPNAIKGKEFLMSGYPHVSGSNAISWSIGKWSCFVTGSPGDGIDSTVSDTSEIINALDRNGQRLLDHPGKLWLADTGASGPGMAMFWQVNDSTWYSLSWDGDPNEAIQVLNSMVYIGGRKAR